MRRIGLFGGTFNPIHNGHLALAQNAYEQCSLDEVWFIPSGISYMKKGQDIPSGMVRYKMVQEAIQGTEHFQVSDIEISRAGNSYTYETLVKLHSLFPEDVFYFIIGDDTLFTMETWYKPEEIFRLSNIIVTSRDVDQSEIRTKINELSHKYGANIFLINAPVVAISSTLIREAVACQKSIEGMVPEAVSRYIYLNDLYKSQLS